jgi:tetratricopeptide (TPR) repeat protein
MDRLFYDDGYINNNSFRGYRGQWYHSYGLDIALGYVYIAELWGAEIPEKLQNKLVKAAEVVNLAITDWDKFKSRKFSGENHNAINDPNNAMKHTHQFAIAIDTLMKIVTGVELEFDPMYLQKRRYQIGKSYGIDELIGFPPNCTLEALKTETEQAINSSKTTQNKSIFVSNEDFNDFLNIPKEERISSCGYRGFSPNWREINKDLAPRIKGYNSKMDNWRKVEGAYSREVLVKYLEASTYAMVSDDLDLKEKLFDKLYQWASKNALSATMQCYSNGPMGVLPACEGEWSDPDGQDIAPIKDATVAVETVMSLNYLYKLYYADYKPGDDKHKVILGWFESFYPRIKASKDFYFGNSVGWHFPNISIKHSLNQDYKYLVENMVRGLDEYSLPDGSLKDRTTRGNRALWYHFTSLGEAFLILEIARITNIEIPVNLEKKLFKAVELFQDAYLDHSVIEPWAKKRNNSQASNGRQEFNSNLDSISFYSSWMPIFQLRYPEHRTAKWFNQELSSRSRSLKSNEITGVPIGCISKALADSSPEMQIKKEGEELKTSETPKVTTSDSDPTVSKVIEVIQGDKFIVDIAEPHELAGTNINLNIRNIDAPDAVRSCPKQLEFGIKVKDIVTQKLADASSIKLKNYRKTSKAVIADVIIDGKDLGAELIGKGYASDEYGYWKAYFCSALQAINAGLVHNRTGNYEKAIFWFERALVLDPEGSNNSRAKYDLSKIYDTYGEYDKSIDYLKQSANLGYMQAEEDLGSAFMNGRGVKKDTSEAKYWLKKAHEHGSKIAEDICGCEF